MRKIFLYLLAAIVFTSCDNLKKKDKTDSEDDTEETSKTKKKKPLEESEETANEDETPKKKKKVDDELPVTTDNENPDDDQPIVLTVDENMKTEMRWTSADRKRFMDECVGTAEKNIGEKRANEYCSCFLGKVEKKYVSYSAANKMTQTELNGWAAECNRQ